MYCMMVDFNYLYTIISKIVNYYVKIFKYLFNKITDHLYLLLNCTLFSNNLLINL